MTDVEAKIDDARASLVDPVIKPRIVPALMAAALMAVSSVSLAAMVVFGPPT